MALDCITNYNQTIKIDKSCDVNTRTPVNTQEGENLLTDNNTKPLNMFLRTHEFKIKWRKEKKERVSETETEMKISRWR